MKCIFRNLIEKIPDNFVNNIMAKSISEIDLSYNKITKLQKTFMNSFIQKK